MAIIRSITSEGSYDTLFIKGKNRNLDLGLKVHLEAKQSVTINQLVIENTFLPLVKSGDGKLTINRLQIKDFGGDGINLQGHNLTINQLVVRNSTPTRPYYTLRVAAPTEINIQAALLASKQKVYDWRLLQWLEITESGQTYFYSPGYHNDIAIQAYRPKQTLIAKSMLQAGKLATVAEPSLHITPDQIESVANNLFPPSLTTGAQARAATPSSVSRLLNLVTDTPHNLDVDNNNRIQSIDLLVPFSTPAGQTSPQTPAPSSPEDLLGIADVTIREIDIQTNDPTVQLFMLSEQQRYRNFKIGTDRIAINCRYPWWFVANTLENSVIGNALQVKINSGSSSVAKVRIGDGQGNSRYCIKPSSCSTDDVTLVGLGKTGHVVPSTVRIL